ncbi:MAG: methyltransferase domain-containing protein [Alphaproteobacteria bacterium]|nr:methyltransferase domain-containing protein [Alphaproteobacteria bacterium]MBU0888692.1 methyltransferase domain-containing protein [Alphaproteobacteria bacterium]MBU1813574.1 methyltransferase domain-containing protein [Alphaproteobacteria bacterium]MBU2089667.1 methyltransferase domain-containing protein [Alphaproteobacteria bacterium]
MSQKYADRAVALATLNAVLDHSQSMEEAFDIAAAGAAGLESRDRGFARIMVATTLKRLGQIDVLLDGFMERKLPASAGPARNALRLGAVQLLFLQVPAHAAIDSMVSLLANSRYAGFKGLVNAVLRRVDREGAAVLAQQDAAMLNLPGWLWHSWVKAYGEDTARAIAATNLTDPPLDIQARENPAHWAQILEATLLPTGAIRRGFGGHIGELPGYDEGAWWVQDAAAALPARLLGDVAGKSVIDLCAAPGGKTAQLAAAGAKVTAVDRSARRLERLSQNMERLGFEVPVVAADGVRWQPKAPVDAVLLDAPCSATGTIRRHPDVALGKTPAEIAKLTALQDRLLANALAMLKPGGMLVYATCSLQPEEGAARIEALLESGTIAAERVPVDPAEIGGWSDCITAAGDLRTLPCHLADQGGFDGFYAARLRRIG